MPDFNEDFFEHFFSSAILTDIFLIPGKIKQDVFIYIHRSSCKVPVILVRF